MTIHSVRLRLPVLAALAAAAAAIWPTWPPLVRTWLGMADYHHGSLLAVFLAGWLYRRGASLPPAAPRASMTAAGLLLATLLGWLIAWRAASSIGQQIMAPPILWLAVWASCGRPVAARIAAPLACLYFAIPVWELLLPALQHLTIAVTETALGDLGVPVVINGAFVTIPEGTFQIVEGCAGKRYLIVALTVAALLAGTAGMRWRRALGYLAITAALALLTNWLRVMTVIYAGHVTDMQSYLVAREHVSIGWAMFAVLVAIVCLIGRRLAPHSAAGQPDSTPFAGSRHAGQRATPLPSETAPGVLATLMHSGVPAALLVLSVAPLAQLYARYALAPGPVSPAAQLPTAAGSWSGPLAPDLRWMPRYPGASSVSRASYSSARGAVQVFVAEYQTQREGAKLISYDNRLLGTDWLRLEAGPLDTPGAPSPAGKAAALWATTPDREAWLVSYLYQVDGIMTASPVLAQLAYGTLSWRGPLPMRLLALAAPCESSCEEAQRRLDEFWSAVGAHMPQASSAVATAPRKGAHDT
jgi:EpsI family protein